MAIAMKAMSVKTANKRLSVDEVLAQALMFLIAGYETTSTTLTACAYELALNPDIQQKLYDEINGAIDSDGEISYDALTGQCFQFLSVCYETTAATLSYCTYELALNPTLQDRLYEETCTRLSSTWEPCESRKYTY